MHRILLSLWLALLMLGGAVPAGAQTFPRFSGLVVDDANVLPAETRADLTQKLQALQRDTKRQFVVATIADVQGYPLEEYGYKLLRAWGIGLEGVDNGAILFIAPNNPAGQRGPRLEVGYGLEPVLTDALSSTIIRQQMMPKLQAGDVPGAMTAGADAVIAQLRASPDEAQARTDAAVVKFDRAQRPRSSGAGMATGTVFFIAVGVILFCMIAFSGRRRRAGPRGQRHRSGTAGDVAQVVLWSIADELTRSAARGGGGGWSGGSSGGWSGGSGGGSGWTGGGFTGGGGGSGGGGGASGNW
ncbi:TPM domain-containing protein [Sphingomonas sp. 2R-10]|uniref:TPM domain-containing protein n=1 Tax=Sphingomonas sp. 2R-10 TaxID=3045148 RepID=UPI000F796B8F|nr:TPM domain-containing protein [Sphingomonas sp. 2R-10]MDJ0276843.1 TPM domain-containing protein [Sphingomonas sp. 2R-10]